MDLLKKILFALALTFANLAYAAPSASTNFLVFSDIHLDANQTEAMEINPNGPVTDPSKMDLDTTTFDSMLQNIQKQFPRPPFILISGDMAGYIPAHVYDDEDTVLKKVNSYYGDEIPKILLFGNEDSLEKPYGAFYYQDGVKGVHSTYELAMQNGWNDGFLSTGAYCQVSPGTYPCIINEDPINGNFSLYLADNLRLIAFNSIVFASDSSNLASRSVTDSEILWIAHELQSAALLNNDILLATHIPPGYDISNLFHGAPFWRSDCQTLFYRLLSFYQDNIIGILTGHAHYDELKVLQNAAYQNVGAVLIAPALITLYGNAPGVRNYFLNRSSSYWAISDYVTYYFLAEANASYSLHQLYDFYDYYCGRKTRGDQSIMDCLDNVNAATMSAYITVGNPHYPPPGGGIIAYPDNIFITLPEVSGSGGGSSSAGALYLVGAAAAAGVGALLIDEAQAAR
jgi:hypothetical protein